MSGFVNTRPTVTTSQILQGAGKITLDGVELGSFQGGVKMTWNQTEKKVTSELALGQIDSEIESIEVRIETELEEATLENMAEVMFGINSSSVLSGTSSKTLDLTPSASMREHSLVVEGMSGTNRQKLRTFTFSKAVRVGSSQTTLQRGTKMTIPIAFDCLMSGSSFGSVVDTTV